MMVENAPFYWTIAIVFFSSMGLYGLKGLKAIWFWRFSLLCSIIGIFIFVRLDMPKEMTLCVYVLVHCLLFPFLSQQNTCPTCGRAYYLKSLFSTKCSHGE